MIEALKDRIDIVIKALISTRVPGDRLLRIGKGEAESLVPDEIKFTKDELDEAYRRI